MRTPRSFGAAGGVSGGHLDRGRGERGSAGIDFLLVTPVLMGVVLMLLMQWGIKMQAAREVDAAAREGAVAAAAFDGTGTAGSTTARAYLSDIGTDVTNIDISADRGQRTAVVSIRAQVRSLVPFVDVHVTSTAQQPVEVFVP